MAALWAAYKVQPAVLVQGARAVRLFGHAALFVAEMIQQTRETDEAPARLNSHLITGGPSCLR
jgi:hypothetical protein